MSKKVKVKRIKVDKRQAGERVRMIWPILKKAYPSAKTELKFQTPLQLLIATILSAQCTDTQVNKVTSVIFKKYKSAGDWANADIKAIESDIKSTGFFRNKAKNIKSACAKIDEQFDGKVPAAIEQMTELAGVGRKTANVVLGNAFGIPAIACDTHVIRLSRRLGLSEEGDAVKLEFDLAEIVPKRNWSLFSHLLIFHGRNICKARKPDCQSCQISKHCPSAFKQSLW